MGAKMQAQAGSVVTDPRGNLSRVPAAPAARPHQNELWLSAQAEALEAALNGAPLAVSLGTLARAATQLLGGNSRAAFYRAGPNGEGLHHVVGMTDAYAKAVEGFPVGAHSLACGLATHSGEAIFTTDVTREPKWADWLWLAEQFDYRGCWSIPIRTSSDQYGGTLAIYWHQPREATALDREIVGLVVQTAAIIVSRQNETEERQRVEAALLDREERLQTELEDAKLLQRISAELITQNDFEMLYAKLVEAVRTIMRADFASMQMLHPERGTGGELQLLSSLGFPREAAEFWTWVSANSNCTCGIALKTHRRVIDPDIANSKIMAGTPDQAALLANGMRAAQSTPLVSRDGRLLGMISTHWRQPHQPAERDLRLLDVLARQAADVVERKQAEENARKQADRLRLLWEAAALLLTADDPDAMLRELLVQIGPHVGVDAYFNYLVTPEGDTLRLASHAGVPEDTVEGMRTLAFGEAICGTAAQQRQAIVAHHIQESADPKAQVVRSLGIRAYACNVLVANRRLLGTLSFGSRTKDRFSPDELAFLETICQYVAVAHERLRLLEDLTESDRRKDEFLATLAHELRNPLAPIRNAAHILRRVGPEDAQIQSNRAVIERQVDNLTRLIDDLLDVSRISRNKLDLRRREVDLLAVIREAVAASRTVTERRQSLSVTLPEGEVVVDGDEVRLGQVFLNLLNNASKYTPEGGSLRVTATRVNAECVVTVSDTGIGIAAENLPRLFDMFFQVDRSLEKSHGGLGIGLSLVRQLVALHGGTIEARSAGPGQGSEFTVRLPVVARATAAPKARADAVQPAARPQGARRLLVADDNRDAADSMAALLRMLGNEVHVAYDGRAAVSAAQLHRPDAVLMDIGMPSLNGYEACRQIRSQPWGRDTVLISLTGWGQDRDRARSLEAGFDAHLLKPVDLAQLNTLLAARPASPTATA